MKRLVCAMALAAGFGVGRAQAEESPASAGKEAVGLSTGTVSSPLDQAEIELAAGHWVRARQLAEAFLDSHRASAEAWALLGRIELASGATGRAQRRFSKALTYNPTYAPAFVGRGMFFEAKHRPDEAANEYQAALRADPGNLAAQAAWKRLKEQASVRE